MKNADHNSTAISSLRPQDIQLKFSGQGIEITSQREDWLALLYYVCRAFRKPTRLADRLADRLTSRVKKHLWYYLNNQKMIKTLYAETNCKLWTIHTGKSEIFNRVTDEKARELIYLSPIIFHNSQICPSLFARAISDASNLLSQRTKETDKYSHGGHVWNKCIWDICA